MVKPTDVSLPKTQDVSLEVGFRAKSIQNVNVISSNGGRQRRERCIIGAAMGELRVFCRKDGL
jgi:hypothetical protein